MLVVLRLGHGSDIGAVGVWNGFSWQFERRPFGGLVGGTVGWLIGWLVVWLVVWLSGCCFGWSLLVVGKLAVW